MPALLASLGEVPAALRVGAGNAILLEGFAAVPGREIEEVSVVVGANEPVRVSVGLPRPGEPVGADWWRAVVPVSPVDGPEQAPIELRARFAGGDAAREVGSIRLEPGDPPAAVAATRRTASGTLVAICLATYEPPLDLLRSQLDSIRAQTHRDWICILSDDCSSSERWEEVKRLVGGDERFRLSRADQRAGFYLNFEQALRSVPPEADYVAFADQDDRWDHDKLETLIAALGDGELLVHSDARVVRPGGETIVPTAWPRGAPLATSLGSLFVASPVIGASCLFRRSVLDWALPFPPPVGNAYHDRWVALVARATGGIAYVDRPLFSYVQHEESVLGHTATVEPGRRRGESRACAFRRRWKGLRRTGFRPGWRVHDDVLTRCAQEAEVLALRLGGRMSRDERRAVERMRGLPKSGSAQAAVVGRWLTDLPRRRPGRDAAVARAIVWRRGVAARNRLARRPGRGGRDAPGAAKRGRRIGIVVTRDSEAEGFGDFQVARELGLELRRLGYEVVNLEAHRGRWRRRIGSVDVLVSLLDGFPLHEAPEGVTCVAWVRNWTERWLERPWFGRYDVVLASSDRSRRLIEDRTERATGLMPLATNPERFRRTAPDPELRSDLLFAGSRWGVARQVEEALPELAGELDVKVYGRGWEEVPRMNGCLGGWLSYERLPAAYSSARVVVDDSAAHTRPYGAVNSRVLDALACGTLVASNDAAGVRTLFDEEFPVWDDGTTLGAHARRARDDPGWASGLAARYREEVIARHTYRHRAAQLRDALAARVENR